MTRRQVQHHLEDESDTEKKIIHGKNYLTPSGLKRLQTEFNHLKNTERPEVTRVVSWAAGNGDRSENGDYTYGKKRLREIDKRLRYLAKRIESAEVIDPSKLNTTVVKFGATVSVQNEAGIEKKYHIVGVDEIDPGRGKISWLSPLASALMGKEEGDVILFRSPGGVQELEVMSVFYGDIPE